MLLEVHNTLQRLLYERGQISPAEVDIQFGRPTREQVDKLIRPTINLFLAEIQENLEMRRSDYLTRRRDDNRVERYLPPRHFDLLYMVSVLTNTIEDEHLLLWRVLTTLGRYPELPAELLSEEMRAAEQAISTKVCQHEAGAQLNSLWSGLGVPPRAALTYVLTLPVDMDPVFDAPLILTRTGRYANMREGEMEFETVIRPRPSSRERGKEK
jgi:hypothetical protein